LKLTTSHPGEKVSEGKPVDFLVSKSRFKGLFISFERLTSLKPKLVINASAEGQTEKSVPKIVRSRARVSLIIENAFFSMAC